MRNSTPHTPQRYRTLILRISPAGGGAGNGEVMLRNMPMPVRQIIISMSTPTRNQTTVPNMNVVLFRGVR
jgi:hypothetical protein